MYVYDIQHDKIKLSLMCWVAVESVHLAGSVSGRRHVVVENALRNQSFVRLAHAFERYNRWDSLPFGGIPKRRSLGDGERKELVTLRNRVDCEHGWSQTSCC